MAPRLRAGSCRPTGRLLDFAPAEVQFLFPAPVRRRDLLIHRLLRSQVGLLFASLIPAIAFSLPSGSPTTAVRTAIAIWAVLVASRVYFSGVTLARSRLMSSDPRLRRVARLPLVVVLAAVLAAGSAVVRDYLRRPFTGPDDVMARLTVVWTTGAPRIVLVPFVALVRPFFADDWMSFAVAVAGALGVGLVAMAWLMVSDDAFQADTGEVVERQQSQARRGKTAYRVRRTDWTLAPTGRPEVRVHLEDRHADAPCRRLARRRCGSWPSWLSLSLLDRDGQSIAGARGHCSDIPPSAGRSTACCWRRRFSGSTSVRTCGTSSC